MTLPYWHMLDWGILKFFWTKMGMHDRVFFVLEYAWLIIMIYTLCLFFSLPLFSIILLLIKLTCEQHNINIDKDIIILLKRYA